MKVSIITPSFNQGQFIERTLQSVACQTGAEIEHVVFDGGSTDNTIDILKRFSPPVRWVSEKDKGQTNAVNKGIRATSGEIIGWLNSDDIYYPGAVARVAALFDANPEIDVVYGDAFHIREDNSIIEHYPTENWDFERLKQVCFICQPATFFRRSVVERFGMLDETLNYCMDYEYWLRLASCGARFSRLQQPLAGSRFYAETKTLGARKKVHAEINRMMQSLFGKVPERWLFNYGHAVMEQTAVDRIAHPRLFLILVAMVSLLAALRWNHAISRDMISTMAKWVSVKP
ncbi:MAG: glycosyltransferase [Burkholderiales bacterium]|nr:glycosyltransferase [Burkholderiales bacterium]MBY0577383.1 glycosyltransferase [Gallionellaceae bacterium]